MAAPLQTELLAELARSFPEAAAWRNLADGRELTLEEWHRRSNRVAHGLAARGIRPGDRVGLVIATDEPLEWLISYIGIHKAGGVTVPLLARLAPAELGSLLRHAGARAALCTDPIPEIIAAVPDVLATRADGAPEVESWESLLGGDDSDLDDPPGADDLADIMFTSGTTGRPKGVLVHHGSLSTMAHVPTDWLGLGFLTSSPFATTSGSLLVSGPLRGGLCGWFLPRFDAPAWIDAVERERPVAGFLVPAMVELIVASPRFESADLSSLAVVNIGSAPIAATTLRRFGAQLTKAEVLCGYGMTEYGAVTAVPMGDGGHHLGSVGIPLPGVELRIVDDVGAPVPVGEVGEVTIGGSRRPRAYDDMAEAAASGEQTWVEGWLQSGDVGYVDDDGHLWIVGRRKEMIIRGGHNVVPGEVEAALFEHVGVAEAAVTGIPHPVLGEDVAAWVVLRSPVDVDELRSFLLARLADFKVPRRITVVDALPRNESGKVLKSQLRPDDESRSPR
jgi:acyl-CoA synthetase (AMP-forming)/AMP-acid ligase II